MKNYSLDIGSSETTRESPFPTFDFTNYIESYRPQHKWKEDTTTTITFLEWFVGFTEGDGCFCCTMEKGRSRVRFTLGQKDVKLLHKIKKGLGFGYIIPDGGGDKFVFRVDDVIGIRRIQSIFNGNLVLPKRRVQFVAWVNFKPQIQGPTFRLIDRPKLPTLQDAWISGFIEAEGCFYVKLDALKNKPGFFYIKSQKLTITQTDVYGEIAVLDHIKKLFRSETKTYLVKRPNCFQIVMEDKRSQQAVVEYLQRFCLLGKKRIAALRWWRLYLMRQNRRKLLLMNQKKLERLCKNLNKSQKEYFDEI